MTNRWIVLLCAVLALCIVRVEVAASADCVELAPGKKVEGLPADADNVVVAVKQVSITLPDSAPDEGVWTITEEQVKAVSTFLDSRTAADRKKAVLRPAKGDDPIAGKALRFAIPPAKCANDGPGAVAESPDPDADDGEKNASTVEPADAEDCFRQAGQWSLSTGRYRQPVLFNSKGAFCYAPPVIREGDLLVVGMLLMPGEKKPDAHAEITACTPEDGSIKFLQSGDVPAALIEQSGRKTSQIRFLGAAPCGSSAPVVTVKLGAGDTETGSPHTVSQSPRYQATFHLGAVYTELHEPKFALRDDDGTQIVFNSDAVDKGPEYVGTVVVQGFLHYFERLKVSSRTPSKVESANLPNWTGENNPDNWPYKGRDPVHDGSWKDRVGFVMSAGLKDPGDRFGVGISFEIARGINVVGLYEMARIQKLEGLEIGDAFTGTVDELPTTRSWESKVSFGLTFDIAYATKLFTSK